MKTVLLGLIAALVSFSAFECSAQRQSKLPARMPEDVKIEFHKNAGMIFAFTKIEIAGGTINVEEKAGNEQKPRKWSAKIEKSELEELYRLFVENRFDTIKNDERKGIVYDAGSEGVSISAGIDFSFNVSYGPNTPLSGDNQKRYQKIANAINALRAKYEGKAQNAADLTFAVIQPDEKEFNIWFRNSSPATLTEEEISTVKNILPKAVGEHNAKKSRTIEKLAEYKFQLVGLINQKGEKEVWVNAFCRDPGQDWQNQIIAVEDGGSCYFNFYVNLTKQTFDRFQVNGEA